METLKNLELEKAKIERELQTSEKNSKHIARITVFLQIVVLYLTWHMLQSYWKGKDNTWAVSKMNIVNIALVILFYVEYRSSMNIYYKYIKIFASDIERQRFIVNLIYILIVFSILFLKPEVVHTNFQAQWLVKSLIILTISLLIVSIIRIYLGVNLIDKKYSLYTISRVLNKVLSKERLMDIKRRLKQWGFEVDM